MSHDHDIPMLREVLIPIHGKTWPSIRAAFPLTEAAWNQMIAVLQAMKPGLVENSEKEDARVA